MWCAETQEGKEVQNDKSLASQYKTHITARDCWVSEG